MAREWLLRGVDPEELKAKQEDKIPETPRSKWENFWYHYKWPFWGIFALSVVLVILVVQTITRDTPDYRILMMTDKAYISDQVDVLEATLAQYGDDLDGDGKVEVQIQNCLLGKGNSMEHSSDHQMVSAHLVAGDVLFFVWEERSYHQFANSMSNVEVKGGDFLTDLPVESDQLSEDGKRWNWKDDPRYTGLLAEFFPENMYFAVRSPIGTAQKSKDMHQQSMDLLVRFIEDTKPAEKPAE